MKKDSTLSMICSNLFELRELPFLKLQLSPWKKIQERQKYLPLIRSITYQCREFMSKIFLFDIRENKKDNKNQRQVVVLTEKQIIGIEELYQILNESIPHNQFSSEVQRIKKFERTVYSYLNGFLAKSYLKYHKDQSYLTFNVYMQGQQFFIKAVFSNYNFEVELSEQSKLAQKPMALKITSPLVHKELMNKYKAILNLSNSIKNYEEIIALYTNFYDKTYFFYDQYYLKLQVFKNYPLLRMKNYLPIKFVDLKTQQRLEGSIFSNSDEDCMYSHFTGYNANTIKLVQGESCQICQLPIEQLQQFQLLTILRDNILNPEKKQIFYCPQYNRFKILSKVPITIEKNEQDMKEQRIIMKTSIQYLNYYHFRINLKKMTNKNRIPFFSDNDQESFSLVFKLNQKQIGIMDPARGRYCQHWAFTDLRLYYLTYDKSTNEYACPYPNCGEKMSDNDILYIKQVKILIDYVKFKCEQSEFFKARIEFDHSNKKVFAVYPIRQQNGAGQVKREQIVDLYKTLENPFIPFREYTLGMKEKEHRQKMDEYMFRGWKEQMQKQNIQQQHESDDEN